MAQASIWRLTSAILGAQSRVFKHQLLAKFRMKFLLLASIASCHMHLQTPPPKYLDQFNENAPSNLGCTIFPPNTGGLAEKVLEFNNQQGQRPLRDFVDACYQQTGSGAKCGKTDPNHIVQVTGGKVVINVGADHVGPSAIYLDDKVLHTNTGIERNTVREHDFGNQLACGNPNGCLLRFVQVALHVSTPEIYDNCVKIGQNSQQPGGEVVVSTNENTDGKQGNKDIPVAEQPIEPILQPIPPTVIVTQNPQPTLVTGSDSDVWSCEGVSLLRVVTTGGQTSKYVIPCAQGTECKINGGFAFCDFRK